jgi:Succinylglutamate desuccinylase / Aspartoacylase family
VKILVIGGMHGNEQLGLQVGKLFCKKPVDNVDVIVANEPAVAANRRFIGEDLNRSFPGRIKSKKYESKRAYELIGISKNYDVVLDFHNTYCPDNDCSFVGQAAGQFLYDVSWLLGLRRVIVADYDCINKYSPNCLSIEVSLASWLNSAELWYERIKTLAILNSFKVEPDLELYKFVYRMTLKDKKKYELDKQRLKAFEPINKQLARELGVKEVAYPIFIGDKFTPYNYGGLVCKLK